MVFLGRKTTFRISLWFCLLNCCQLEPRAPEIWWCFLLACCKGLSFKCQECNCYYNDYFFRPLAIKIDFSDVSLLLFELLMGELARHLSFIKILLSDQQWVFNQLYEDAILHDCRSTLNSSIMPPSWRESLMISMLDLMKHRGSFQKWGRSSQDWRTGLIMQCSSTIFWSSACIAWRTWPGLIKKPLSKAEREFKSDTRNQFYARSNFNEIMQISGRHSYKGPSITMSFAKKMISLCSNPFLLPLSHNSLVDFWSKFTFVFWWL